jgi:UDP-2,3-diacylglucosamine hydrolase
LLFWVVVTKLFTPDYSNHFFNAEVGLGAVFFMSDAHLGFAEPGEETHREETILGFFNWITGNADSLYIVGDLFDFWFEYASVIPRRFIRIVCGLESLRRSGVEIHYIVGNHDCWMERFFPDEMGIPIYTEPVTPVLHGKRFFIAHGDGLARKDLGYRVLKKIIRNRFVVRLYKTLHPNIAFGTASFFSRLSRNHRPIKDKDQEYAGCARTLFARGFECVVFGHTHRPFALDENGRTYVNLGDWMEHFTYARLEEGRLTLEHWQPGKRVPDMVPDLSGTKAC